MAWRARTANGKQQKEHDERFKKATDFDMESKQTGDIMSGYLCDLTTRDEVSEPIQGLKRLGGTGLYSGTGKVGPKNRITQGRDESSSEIEEKEEEEGSPSNQFLVSSHYQSTAQFRLSIHHHRSRAAEPQPYNKLDFNHNLKPVLLRMIHFQIES
ncbi:hypothetical protein CROQUDRAFT_98157 [Cronartium quercuum f. sp. fusiforme G11]|uniref:Uncharacterized protein n=1 Tax=Cronartium quercuum f. sp. fusiforme G11 TaxID=708437 RepID=A0A9P6N9Q4_9BASI|nr:hypothetical protein CROQUDRAFT_98157 [Cronartium quercuum f. sp. fusiforme G11]